MEDLKKSGLARDMGPDASGEGNGAESEETVVGIYSRVKF